jgi:preprotein translocase subunit SecA
MFSQILKHLYGAGEYKPRLVYVTSFIESRMTLKERLNANGDEDKWDKVQQEIASTQSTHCTLLVVQDIGTAYQVAEPVASVAAKVFQFTGDGRDNKIASQQYEAGQVVITTAVGSRGVDWHCTAPGGFEVIATLMSKSVRVQRQIQGRAGRSGQKGSYIEIVSEQEVNEALKQWGLHQGHIVRLVKGSLQNDLRTDTIQQMSDKVKAAASVSGKKSEYKMRFDRFRLWMSDKRYSQLSKGLNTLIKAYVNDNPEGADDEFRVFLSDFSDEMIGDSREQVSATEVLEKISGGIQEHKLAFKYLFAEVAKNAAYKQYVTDCVSEGACNDIPDFQVSE